MRSVLDTAGEGFNVQFNANAVSGTVVVYPPRRGSERRVREWLDCFRIYVSAKLSKEKATAWKRFSGYWP
jgi:hypothetical protein